MATKVLDSWALIAFFEDEPPADDVEKLLQQAADEKHKLLMSVVNWGEVYYNTMREVSQEAAEQKAHEIAALPIDIIGVGDDLTLAKQAAIFKAKQPDGLRRLLRRRAGQTEERRTHHRRPGVQSGGEGNQDRLAEPRRMKKLRSTDFCLKRRIGTSRLASKNHPITR